jgi:uncharacterized protein YndB with AHSA1/START domain
MSTATIPEVRKEITVDVPVERAFEVFTAGMSTWWPRDSHHIGEQEMAEAVMEPRAGGRWFERGVDGAECDWGKVRAWEPPHRVVLGWHLNGSWAYDPDDEHASEVEVTFSPEGEGATRVELWHRNLERMTVGAAEARAAIDGEGGWSGLLARFKEAAEAGPSS